MRSNHNEAILTKQQFKQLYQETVSHNNDNGFSNVGRTRLKALTTSLYTYMLRNAMFVNKDAICASKQGRPHKEYTVAK